MPFQKGNRANPGGRTKEKEFADAIRIVCKEEHGTAKKRKLRIIAEKVVAAAMKGEPWACNMVADRLDGKPAQEGTLTIDDRRDIDQWSDAELLSGS